MSNGHFDFFMLDKFGCPYGSVAKVATITGLILQCPPRMSVAQIRRLADLARETPDYPVDLSHWEGPEGERYMTWNARIYWRGPKIGGR